MKARRACATRLWLGLALFALFAVACQRAAAPAADAVARIGETDVGYAEFERYVRRNVGNVGDDGALGNDVLSQLFDQFLEERLLARLAVDQKRARADADPRQALSALIAAAPQAAPGDEEIARYYQAHRGEFARPERVRLRQILTEDRATAEKARREIAAGTPFEVVARRLASPGAGAKTASSVGILAGNQGELARTDLPPSFADLIFALRAGEVSPVVPASYGFHLFQVVSRQPAEVVAPAAARGEIVAKLREAGADRRLRALVEEARGRYNTKVYERNLPFGYEGAYSEKHAQKTS
jgi:parvulin-like peptidyl-prolyl isomerase